MAYVGTWPTTVGFKTMNFKTVSNTKMTTSQSGRTIRVSVAGSRFSVTIQYPQMTSQDMKAIQAIATRLKGPLNSFDITLPFISYNSNGAGYGLAATVNDASATQGSTAITIATNKNSQTVLYAGDVVKFASHNKVYMVVTDVTTNGSGAGTLNIEPALFEDVANSSTITNNAVPFRMRLERDIQEFKYSTDDTATYELDMIEEL
jgi:hypothetical protein